MDCTSTRHQSKTIENYKITKERKAKANRLDEIFLCPPRICVLFYAVFLFCLHCFAVFILLYASRIVNKKIIIRYNKFLPLTSGERGSG